MAKRIHIIINPGSGQPKPVLHTLNTVLRPAGAEWDVSVTQQSGDVERFAREAAAVGVDVVAVFGGDGTVMEAVTGLLDSEIPLAILPGGTANVMSVELGVPRDLLAACQVLVDETAEVQAVDLGLTGDRYFMLRLGIGFAAEHVIGATREMKDRFGVLAYTISALKTLQNLPQAQYRLTLDGNQFEVEGSSCRVDNSGNIGIPGLNFAADIKINDGLLDVTVMRSVDGSTLASVASSGTEGLPVSDLYNHWQAREISIETDPPQSIVGDGESWGQTPVGIQVVPGAARFLAPVISGTK